MGIGFRQLTLGDISRRRISRRMGHTRARLSPRTMPLTVRDARMRRRRRLHDHAHTTEELAAAFAPDDLKRQIL